MSEQKEDTKKARVRPTAGGSYKRTKGSDQLVQVEKSTAPGSGPRDDKGEPISRLVTASEAGGAPPVEPTVADLVALVKDGERSLAVSELQARADAAGVKIRVSRELRDEALRLKADADTRAKAAQQASGDDAGGQGNQGETK